MSAAKISRRLLIAFFFWLAIATSFAQAESKQPDEGDDGKPLVIGLVPEQNIFKQVERYSPLADFLSEKIGHRIKLTVMTRYGDIINNFVSSGLDGAFFGGLTYVLAHAKIGVEVLARPEDLNGSSTYHGIIFVRKESKIKNVKDMKGKRFALVDKASLAGFLLPLAYFRQHGIRDHKAYLKETYYTGTQEDTIYDVLNKKADIGAAKNTVFKMLATTEPRIRRELKILTRSPDIPENALAVREGLDASLKQAIEEALLTMHNDPAGRTVLKNFGARRFIRTTDKDYEPVFRYAQEIKLNLAQFDYMNE